MTPVWAKVGADAYMLRNCLVFRMTDSEWVATAVGEHDSQIVDSRETAMRLCEGWMAPGWTKVGACIGP
jgi:hypothetical protein